MRPTLALTALGLAITHVAGHVAGQQQQKQQWQDFGAMPDPMKQSFYDAVARPAFLAKRDGDCSEGRHPCEQPPPPQGSSISRTIHRPQSPDEQDTKPQAPGSDLNSTLCCPNTDYCVINDTSLSVQCCALGSTCGFRCGTESYYAVVTITETNSAGSGSATTTTAGACVGRPCPTSTNYLCPESMGGKCCAYGQNCASSGQCLDFGAEATSTSSDNGGGPTVATMIPSGCSTQGDSTCSVGGNGLATTTGCCGAGYTCAVDANSQAICAPASSTAGPVPTGSGISVVSQDQGGLSTGAKAGIAVGVVVASAIIIGAATWFCLRRRRSGRSTTTGNELGSGIGAGGSASGGGGRPNHRNRLAAAGRYESDDGGIQAYGPSSGPHMSEADGYAASSSAGGGGGVRGGPPPGLGQDYFGPVAASGPYTTPPEYPNNNNRQYYGGDDPARPVRGDGATAHGPDDIASAVEIGGGGGSEDSLVAVGKKKGGDEEGGSELDGGSDTMLAARRQDMRQGVGSPAVRDSIMGRFELYGTDVPVDTRAPRPLGTPGSELSASELGTPSPMSHEEQQQQGQSNKKTGPAG